MNNHFTTSERVLPPVEFSKVVCVRTVINFGNWYRTLWRNLISFVTFLSYLVSYFMIKSCLLLCIPLETSRGIGSGPVIISFLWLISCLQSFTNDDYMDNLAFHSVSDTVWRKRENELPTVGNHYRKTSNISRTSVGDEIVDNSDVVGASPVGAAPTTSSFST